MQPERFVTCGLVLRETDTRDADKILTVLTRTGESWRSSPGAPGARAAAWPQPASCWRIPR